ncbi:sugar phosphate isomerase/epimerase family protein [Devosia nitrariae]|uniref:Xylose isomerase n=1 Tax=Devosia nitrariae TaxID=2071872 RepID=A0ABQ5W014_9HYPH|nr:sugar phosphate isomerase/epimerase [Devosia nitrariae]GLQ53235.1 xylose isomerase [Devosia nitrariae]
MAFTVATDIITFYHPAFWGLKNFDEVQAWVAAHPRQFWDKVLRALGEAGVTGLELTFGPGSIESALEAFGTAAAFKTALDAEGITVVSAFVADGPKWDGPADTAAIVADAQRRADFLGELNAGILVAGLPMRKTFGEQPPVFVDGRYMERMADIAHAVGEAVSRQGIKLVLHTESNSTLWYERDIDLFMALTDPRYVWLCPDSCHIALGGGDPVKVAQRHSQRTALAHWKDALGPIDRHLVIDSTIYDQQQRYMADFGKGIVDWAGWSAAMDRTPGRDIALIELDMAADPIAALTEGGAVVSRYQS